MSTDENDQMIELSKTKSELLRQYVIGDFFLNHIER